MKIKRLFLKEINEKQTLCYISVISLKLTTEDDIPSLLISKGIQ
jgi:hypothetical protein